MIYAANLYSFLQRASSGAQNRRNWNFLYDTLEMLGLDLLAWQSPSLERFSKRQYACLNDCQRRCIPFRYTPFDQGALASNLAPDWHGACNILSLTWVRRKIESEDLMAPSTYRITDSHLPHPMIVGDNRNNGPDAQEIREQLQFSFGEPIAKNQSEIEKQFKMTGVKALLEYFKSFESHSTLMGSYALNRPPALMAPGPFVAHACAFVKRGDQCAWFDANHGEVAFERFDDFARWFTRETTKGVLSFILKSNKLPENKCLVSQLYDRPRFTESERRENTLSERLVQKRDQAQDFKIALVPDYTIETYSI